MQTTAQMPLNHAERKFDIFEISWLVENFSLVKYSERIQSPTFTTRGPIKSKWSMFLKMAKDVENSDSVLFVLKRVDSETEREKMWVDFRLRFFSLYNNIFYADRKLCCSTEEYLYETKLEFEDCFIPLESDLLTVECEMIIYGEETDNGLRKCSHVGLKSLSEDLLNLYRTSKYHDLEIKMEENTILAHKSIVRARCEKLNNDVEEASSLGFKLSKEDDSGQKDDSCLKVELSGYSYEGMKKVLAYLYSGDLKHVLEKPSLELYDCISGLNIKDTENYYIPDRMVFRSTVKSQSYTFKWDIEYVTKVFQSNYYIDSPEFTEDSFNTSWKLKLFAQNEENKVTIFAETLQTDLELGVCLECGITNRYDDKVSCSDMKKGPIEHFTSSKILEFSRKNLKAYAVDDVLRVTLKLRLFQNNKEYSNVKRQETCFLSNPEQDLSYKFLSLDLEYMFDAGYSSDGAIKNNSVNFLIHKCILAARSSVFSRMLSEISDKSQPLIISNFKPHILSIVLTYIYSGASPELEDRDIGEVRDAAIAFNLPLLEEHCNEVSKKDEQVEQQKLNSMLNDLKV